MPNFVHNSKEGLKNLSDDLWKKTEKLLCITESSGDIALINKEIERLGYSIGCRLVDDFYARSLLPPCRSFRDCIEVITKVACRTYFGCFASSLDWDEDETCCNVTIEENPWVSYMLPGLNDGGLSTPSETIPSPPLMNFDEFISRGLHKRLSVSLIWVGLLRGIFEVVSIDSLLISTIVTDEGAHFHIEGGFSRIPCPASRWQSHNASRLGEINKIIKVY